MALPPIQVIGATPPSDPSSSSWVAPVIVFGGLAAGAYWLLKPSKPKKASTVKSPKFYVSYNYIGDDGKKKRGDSGYTFYSHDQAQQWVDTELVDAEAEYGFSPDPHIYSR